MQTETVKLTPAQRESLRSAWIERNKDIMSGVPAVLPPLRDINHEIPLVDDQKQYKYYRARCPDAMKPQLLDKINKYIAAKWWVPTNV